MPATQNKSRELRLRGVKMLLHLNTNQFLFEAVFGQQAEENGYNKMQKVIPELSQASEPNLPTLRQGPRDTGVVSPGKDHSEPTSRDTEGNFSEENFMGQLRETKNHD